MNQKSIHKNYFWNMIFQLLTVLTPLITAPYVARTLQPEGVGTFSFVNSITSYFVLIANLGTVTYAQREISYVQDDVDKRSGTFWNVFFLRLMTSTVTLVAYLVFSFTSEFKLLFYILSMNIFSVIFDVSWFYQGIEEFEPIMRKNIFFRILTVCAIFAFVHHEEDLPIYVLILGLGNLSANLSQWIQLRTRICRPNLKAIRPFSDIRTVLSLFIPTIAIQVYTILDKTMIGLFSGVGAENGYYEEAMKFARITQTLVTSLSTVMIPRIGSCFAQQKLEEAKEYLYKSYQYVWAVAIPMCFGLMGISDNLVPWFLGSNYEKVSTLLKILSLLLISIGINTITGNEYLIPTNRQKWYTRTVLLGAMVNVCFNAALIPKLYSLGAAIASVLAETCIAVYQIYLVRGELSATEIIKRARNYVVAGIGILLIVRVENRYLSASPLHTLCMVSSGAAVYGLILILLKDAFLKEQLKAAIEVFTHRNTQNN